jgi:aspartate 1-decarboxylase
MRTKTHPAVVTRADLNYEGSIAIDAALLSEAKIYPFEVVQVWNINDGRCLEAYAPPPRRDPRGDLLEWHPPRAIQRPSIMTSFGWLDERSSSSYSGRVVLVDHQNQTARQ